MKKHLLKYACVFPLCVSISGASINEINENIIHKDKTFKFSYIYRVGNIYETNSLNEIAKYIGKVDSETVLGVDIDETLLKRTVVALAPEHEDKYNALEEEYLKQYPEAKSENDEITASMFKTIPEIWVDLAWPEFLEAFRGHGGKVIALTALNNHRIGDEMLIDIRYKKLKDLGFDFAKSFNINSFAINKDGLSPYYSNGIITTYPWFKGEAFIEFLKKTSLEVKKVAFIDNVFDNVCDMRQACLTRGIEFIGIYFTGEKQLKHRFAYSEDRAKYQTKCLYKEHKLISDAEAESRMAEEALSTKQKTILPFVERKTNPNEDPNMERIEEKGYIYPVSIIYETNSPNSVKQIIGKGRKDDLFLVCIDGIMLPTNIALSEENNQLWEITQDEYYNKNPIQQEDFLRIQKQFIKTYEEQVIEDEWIRLTDAMAKNTVTKLAITKIKNCMIQDEMMIDIRIKKLKDTWLYLGDSFLKPGFRLTEENNLTSYYKDGLITAGSLSKSAALRKFFEQVEYKPKRIIYIDKQYVDIDEMQRMCKREGIECVGIWYIHKSNGELNTSYDPDMAHYQLTHLHEDGYFMTDKATATKIHERIVQGISNIKAVMAQLGIRKGETK